MSQKIILIQCTSEPRRSWYKVFASGDVDPDIHADWLLQQFTKYSICDVRIAASYKCHDSAAALEKINAQLHNHIHEKFGPVPFGYPSMMNRGWSNAKISYIRNLITQTISDQNVKK